MFAGSRGYALWVEFRVLIEGDGVWSMGRAEDVTAMTAVVSAEENVERSGAAGRVADLGGGVGL